MSSKFSFVIVTFAALLFAGCQSNSHAPATASSAAGKSVMCDKCNATWQQKTVVNDKGNSVPTVTASQSGTCPSCQKAAEDYFATGTPPTHCHSCGGMMHVME